MNDIFRGLGAHLPLFGVGVLFAPFLVLWVVNPLLGVVWFLAPISGLVGLLVPFQPQ